RDDLPRIRGEEEGLHEGLLRFEGAGPSRSQGRGGQEEREGEPNAAETGGGDHHCPPWVRELSTSLRGTVSTIVVGWPCASTPGIRISTRSLSPPGASGSSTSPANSWSVSGGAGARAGGVPGASAVAWNPAGISIVPTSLK